MLESTSQFKVNRIIFDDGSFAIAVGRWKGSDKDGLACRWHDDKLGYPQTYGKPQWMALPSYCVAKVHDISLPRPKVELSFK